MFKIMWYTQISFTFSEYKKFFLVAIAYNTFYDNFGWVLSLLISVSLVVKNSVTFYCFYVRGNFTTYTL